MKKTVFLLILAIAGAGALFFAFSKRSHCFHPSFCLTAPENLAAFEKSASPSPSVHHILKQKFTFLSSGNQSYAFASEDGQYVLKLMKFHTTTDPKKLKRLLNGFATASKIAPEHQGLIYLHVPPETPFSEPVLVIDRAHRKHSLDLNRYFFALQKRAVPTKEYLNQLPDDESRRQAIETLLDMIASDLRLGLYDEDHNILHNTGFHEGVPMRIDVGKLSYNSAMQDPEAIRQEIEKLRTERLNLYFKKP